MTVLIFISILVTVSLFVSQVFDLFENSRVVEWFNKESVLHEYDPTGEYTYKHQNPLFKE